jgi:hypothetical protein
MRGKCSSVTCVVHNSRFMPYFIGEAPVVKSDARMARIVGYVAGVGKR